MLTYEDGEPSIRHAIWRRLSKEKGVGIVDIKIIPRKKDDHYIFDGEHRIAKDDHIAVGVFLVLKDTASDLEGTGLVDVKSFFELPSSFHIADVRNEIDEIAEQIKKARREAGLRVLWNPISASFRKLLPGTGLRRRWAA